MTPYSALASGRLSRKPGETSPRLEQDAYAKFKYDATRDQDEVIIRRVAELAEKRGVTTTEISLAWLLTKTTSPVVGTTKLHHIEGAAKAVDLHLTDEEIAYLEEPYAPHPLAGVMAQNKAANAKEKHVWSTGSQKTLWYFMSKEAFIMQNNLPKIALGAWAWGNDGTFGGEMTADTLRGWID